MAAALAFALLCYVRYRLTRNDFDAYQRIAEGISAREDDRYRYLCDLLDELKEYIKTTKTT
jgi:hypothetical protein